MLEAAFEYAGTVRFPSRGRVLKLAVGQLLISIAGMVLNEQSLQLSGVSLIWLANGFLIGAFLCCPREEWPGMLLVAAIIDFSVNAEPGNPLGQSAYFAFCNMSEVMVAALLMHSTVGKEADLTERRQFRAFLLYGILLAPSIAALMASLSLHVVNGMSFWQSMRFWFAADLVGIATSTPLYFAVHQRKAFSPRSRVEVWGLFLLLVAVTETVFHLTGYPMLWVVELTLLLLGVRLGFTASAAGLLVVTFVGGYWTVHLSGPFNQRLPGSLATKVLFFQIFIAASMFALYLTEAAMSSKRRVLEKLEASETQFRSIAEACRDVIVLTEMNGMRRYISPAVTEVLGWQPKELLGRNFAQLALSEDVPKIQLILEELVAGRNARPFAYRALRADGARLWIEASSRVLRTADTGKPTGFVHVLRDISERKAAEEKLQGAFEAAELQAMRDGLTGVANRRLLDLTLTREWFSGCRERSTLSLLLIDVDRFKAYNDRYGHLAGDECLRRVAAAMQGVLQRPMDMLARYGGEEFIAVLPSTPESGAEVLAECIRNAVEASGIRHEDSADGVVTVSVGCASVIPWPQSDASSLVSAADAALYRAKSSGRNRIEVAWETKQVS